ncbi:MAG: Rpp14/Pop5 family protein [Candidatus Bathyarchaeota archaeon]
MVKFFKRRYLLFQLNSQSRKPSKDDVHRNLQDIMLHLFGAYGLSQMRMYLVSYDEEKGLGILSCSNTFLDRVRIALIFLSSLDGEPTFIQVMKTSGTIKSLTG